MAATARQLAAMVAGAAGLSLAATGGAMAHPHVWVATKSQVLFENGALTALRYTWLFDEMYTANAVEGLDKNKDGKLDASELDELTKVNIEGLKEFEYFTQLVVGGEAQQFADPRDYGMEVVEMAEAPGPQMIAGPANAPTGPAGTSAPAEPRGFWGRWADWLSGLVGRPKTAVAPSTDAPPAASAEKQKVLALHMTLPLKAAVPAANLDGTAKGMQFTLNDAQMFIWFQPVPKEGLTLAAGAPANCRALFIEPEPTEEQKKLADAFGRAGGGAGIFSTGKSATVVCK